MNVLCCNIRTSHARDGDNGWTQRKALCARVLRAQKPEVIGFQEMSAEQYADLAAEFPEFETFGMADEPAGNRPQNALFFLRDLFTRVSAGGYWLSQTPHVAGSRSWDSACIRLANWVRLKDRRTGKEFRLVNTHLDHKSQPAREGQAALLVEDARAYPADYPQLLMGDLNCERTSKAIGLLKAGGWIDTYGLIHGETEPGRTYHGFLGPACDSPPDGKIDWIFMRGALSASSSEIVRDSENGRFPSDHYFLSAVVL